MRKHIYLNTSNLDVINDLKHDLAFEPAFEYPRHEHNKTHQNEYGRIKTDTNFYHILVGKIQPNGCPWCGNEPRLRKLTTSVIGPYTYCLECPFCGARSPLIHLTVDEDEGPIRDEIIQLLKDRFKNRAPWDANLKNPYEVNHD